MRKLALLGYHDNLKKLMLTNPKTEDDLELLVKITARH